jgi:hypothetical protein
MKKLLLFVLFFYFSISYSQISLISIKIEICDSSDFYEYKNCDEYYFKTNIIINRELKKITIKNDVVDYEYRIIDESKINGVIVFRLNEKSGTEYYSEFDMTNRIFKIIYFGVISDSYTTLYHIN